ncbi:MAG: nucleotide-binding protein [Methanomicrobiaceae archaeon]|nr:nucleotide-binding protein [Methanomicrobiaceae archaeon]MDD5418332.1 nucleotide-binding protein [Methanomicrobiaceae archaeon]
MIYVLDASAFFSDLPPAEQSFTTPSVVAELVDLRSKSRYEVLLAAGLIVREPDEASLARVEEAAERTGDAGVLSPADRDILALALELEGVLVTDDFAVQNVAHRLNVTTQSIQQRSARPLRWRFRCTGCGRYGKREGVCPVCGAAMKRTLK